MSSNVLMVPNCKEDNSADVRWNLLPLSISFLPHTHILTHHPSLSSGPISLSPLLLSNGPANFLVHFTEMWQIPCDTKGVRAPQSYSLARSARERVDQPLRSWTPLNIHKRLYKPACERLVSANSRATKRNFCSELKHLPISQLWRTHNKLTSYERV